MLSRLRIRQKLSLLLMIPLTAVIVTLVPFTAERIDDARSAGATATAARSAREVGAFIQNLQQERLLALGFLTNPALDRSALISQAQLAVDETAALRAQPATRDILEAAAGPLAIVDAIRDRVITRSVTSGEVYDAYRKANTALLEALALANPTRADARGYRQLGALDALMRANEEASGAGAVLVAAAGDKSMDRTLLTGNLIAQQLDTERFRRLVSAEQAKLVDDVEQGKAGQRLVALMADLNRTGEVPSGRPVVKVSDALTAAVAYTGLRRLAQDRIAREIADEAASRARVAQIAAGGVGGAAALLLAVVIVLGVIVSRSISSPLRRLTRAAAMVAELAGTELVRVADSDDLDPAPPRLAAVDIRSNDEVGELAVALNRVQATAALLLERQVTSRRNVAVMFANIARRTQNLVGRQLSLIDDLERTEQNATLLHRLFRLDHVATRLRRSADSLLVVSGTIDQGVSGTPTALVDVIRSALSEIEGYQSIKLGQICEVTVSPGLVADLRLLLAELMENAVSFSPPGTPVEVSATLADECRIVVTDHGLGLIAARMEEENQRLVERERLDLAPTTALGLFVVGRLARRHGLAVRLDPSPGRGVTATVSVPLRLLSAGILLPGPRPSAPGRRIRAAAPLSIESAPPNGSFDWFAEPGPATSDPSNGQPAAPTPAEPAAQSPPGAEPATSPPPAEPAAQSRLRGLTRRRPGQHLVAFDQTDDPPTQPLPSRDPQAERDALDAFAAGTVAGSAVGRAAVPIVSPGLVRRVPGSHMSEAVRQFADAPAPMAGARNPEAERDEVMTFMAGYDRGSRADTDLPNRRERRT